ncbi:MAG: hypothetical protein Q4G16_12350 [Cruoricaptor ignavus]|nr:hypothetical protein [Cruoricaptor ignavus]
MKSFEEFCELAISKINLKNSETCTSQQAFYRLRQALLKEEIIANIQNLNINTELKSLFPRKNRKQLIKKIEQNLGFQLNILSVPQFIINLLVLLLIASFIMFSFDWKIAIAGIFISIFGLYLSKFGKELQVKTIRELIKKMTTQNYLDVRRDKNTVNKSELKSVIIHWFSENACIESERLRVGNFT